jgi:hypothetical protein
MFVVILVVGAIGQIGWRKCYRSACHESSDDGSVFAYFDILIKENASFGTSGQEKWRLDFAVKYYSARASE